MDAPIQAGGEFYVRSESVFPKREILNLRIIMADPDAYQAFHTRLDQAPSPNAALRKTMQTPAPWEQKK